MINQYSKLELLKSISVIGPLSKKLPKNLSSPAVFIDGGSHLSHEIERSKSIIIGDGDSSDRTITFDQNLPQNKDFSDLAYFLSLPILEESSPDLELCGFIGGRVDHQLAVFGEAHRYLTKKEQTRIIFDEGQSGYFLSPGEFTLNIKGVFSCFVLQPTEIQITGQCQFCLNQLTALSPLSSHGLSNEGSGEIKISCKGPTLILTGTSTL